MKQKQTLFNYLYNNLHDLIVSGRLPYGSKLPSISELCEFYNIGIRTVKDVLHVLKEEGYISTHERKATTVVYNIHSKFKEDGLEYVLEHRQEIIDVYKTIGLIMPVIFSFAAQIWDEEDLQLCSQRLKESEDKSAEERERICTRIFFELLDKSHNPLLRDIFSSLEIYARPVFFVNYEKYINYFNLEYTFKSITWVTSSLLTRDKSEIEYRFGLMYDTVINVIEKTLTDLALKYPEIKEMTPNYTWSAELGRDHCYTQIARDLINKISLGIYPVGSFLPPEAKLAKMYKVSVSTIRKSLHMLNELGFGETMNVKGTRVVIQDEQTAIKCMQNKQYRQDTLLYLNGVQAMVILIKKAATLAFPNITQEKIKNLQGEIEDSKNLMLEYLLNCIVDNLPLLPFKTIIQETNKIIYWGYYFAFYPSEKQSINIINIKSKKALEYLCLGEAECFADEISSSYNHSLNVVRDYLIEYGLGEAKNIISPE